MSFTIFSSPNTEGLIGLLEKRRGQDGAYIGCMKSGDVIAEEYTFLPYTFVPLYCKFPLVDLDFFLR